jgi:predicted O-methyltransferase YrrM
VTAGGSSIPEVQTLLRVLAAGRKRAAEIGTGFGEGAAAIAEGLAPDGWLVTVDLDLERARIAEERLAGCENVTVFRGGWETIADLAPFDFVFVDAHPAKTDPFVLDLVEPGALLVIDDLTPGRPGPDEVRDFWLRNDKLAAVEIMTTPGTAAIVATRLP